MESFDFGALDSAAFEETLAFLENYDPTLLLPDPPSEGSGQPVMDYWPAAENPASWNMLGSASLSGGVPDALTESPGPGFELASYGLGSGGNQSELYPVAGPGTTCDRGESGYLSPNDGPQSGGNKLWNLDPLSNEMVFPCFTCDWPSCTSSITYGSELELSYHKTDVHVAKILKGWPGSCSWPGCTSKIIFKTSKRLESHVYNIHITPLCCNEAQCDYKKPFERQADLERHIASRHLREQKYKCRYHQCRHYTTSFARKDKLKLHYDTCHNDKFRCRVNHCVHGFASEIAQMKHCYSSEKHSFWFRIECGIGSCRLTSKSHFDYYQLRKHLKYDHKISAKVATQTINSLYPTMHSTDSWTLTHLPAGLSEFEDCESCVQKLKESASGEGVEQHE